MFKSLLLKFPWLYKQVQAIRDHFSHRKCLKRGSYAQHREDVEIMKLLSRANAHGPYVDVGSNHPFKINNTYLLYLNGWRGLCIDPLPRFTDLYRQWRPDDVFECVGIGEQSGEMTLFEFESDVLSTLDPVLADQYRQMGYKFRRELRTKIRTIDALLESCAISAPISLLSVDIEGHELSALKSITLDKWKPAFICLEAYTADGKSNEPAIRYLHENGYRVENDMGLNLLFSRH